MKKSTRLLSMLHFLPGGMFLYLAYLNETGHILHPKNPRRFNEKLNFIRLRGGAEEWSRFVDKLEVREHVRRVVGETHLVPLIAEYDSVEKFSLVLTVPPWYNKINPEREDVLRCVLSL